MAETALPVPAYSSDSVTFAGWRIDGAGDAIFALPAGTSGDVTLVATWIGAQTIAVTATTNDVVTQVEIKVTDEWATNNVAGVTAENVSASADAIQAALNEAFNQAKKLNMQMSVEGIENMEQLTMLRKCGCTEGQGFFLFKPIPVKEYEELVNTDEGKKR